MDLQMEVYEYPGYMSKIKGYNKQGPNLQSLERVNNYDYKPKADINEIIAALDNALTACPQ